MTIRPYTSEDKSEVITLLRLNTPLYFDPSEEPELDAYLDEEAEDYFIAEEGGEVLGAGGVNYFPKEKTARIAWDFVRPDQQGKGIGRKLVAYRINHIKNKEDYQKVIVRTSQLAYQFYEKQGFSLVRISKDHWAEGYDLYLMELTLDNY